MPVYDKSTKFLGKKCKSVIAGINGKGFIYKKNFYWLTNNPAESLNSEIDFYQMFYEKKLLEASSMLEQAFGNGNVCLQD